MQSIQLRRKKVKKFMLEDKELMLSIDSTTINHFQKVNKKGFLKLMEELQNAEKNGEMPIKEMIQLLGSCTQYMNGQPVGHKFFKEYDEFDIISKLMPELYSLFTDNLPQAKGENEKK